MNKDLTVGNPSKMLWLFCMPLFASAVFQQLYNIADSFVAGRFIGEAALAAVGNSYEITLIFIAFAFGCNVGCSVVTSRLFGAKKYEDMKTGVSTTFIFGGVLCLLLMAGGFIFGGMLLHLINTPENVFADSLLYLNIYILGLPFMFCYNIATGVFSALGDSKTPFIFLMCSSVSNIAVDIIFVVYISQSVASVAWATFICQGISCILAAAVVFRRLKGIEAAHSKIFSWNILGKTLEIAIPSILQQSFISVGNIIIQGVINSFGSSVMAGYSASVKLNNLVITSLTTVGNGISNFTAQNVGANKLNRIKAGFWAGLKMVWTLCIPLSLLYFFGGRYLINIFLKDNTGMAMTSGLQMLHIITPFYVVVSAKLATDGVLRGMSKMGMFMIATFSDLVLRVVLAKALSASMGTIGIWSAWPIGWSVGLALSFIFYLKVVYHRNKKP